MIVNPIRFDEMNMVFSPPKETPQYQNLPALKTQDDHIISCWKMTFKERLKVLFGGIVWMGIRGERPQPVFLSTVCPFYTPDQIVEVEAETLKGIITARKPIGRFFAKDGPGYVGVDNSTGDAWTEDFKSRGRCIRWLKGGDFPGAPGYSKKGGNGETQ